MTAPARVEQRLLFEDESHTYTLDGVRIPSVTTILSFGQDLSRIPRWTAERGTALHLATEYDDAGDLDESSVGPLVKPHLDAYREWRARYQPKYIATEERVWGELDGLRYAGCIDRVAMLGNCLAVIDIKSGAPRKEHGAQLAAYAHAWRLQNGSVPAARIGLYVGKDGRAEMKEYRGPQHLEAFSVALARWWDAQGGEAA
jgi:hypothetical protein